jgi:hypothetical protein
LYDFMPVPQKHHNTAQPGEARFVLFYCGAAIKYLFQRRGLYPLWQ